MGAVGATYMLTADALCLTAEEQTKRLRAEITIVDCMGIVGVGHGPSSYSVGRHLSEPQTSRQTTTTLWQSTCSKPTIV